MAEPPISRAADGRIVYQPLLSIDESFGPGLFMMRRVDFPAARATEVVLMDPEDFDQPVRITAEDREAAAPIDEAVAALRERAPQAWEGEGEGAPPPAGGLPDLVDHRPFQSQVKNQRQRNTCVSHTSMALLEAMPNIPDDLSEQYTHYKFMEFLNVPHDQDRGLMTTDAARFLSQDDGLVSQEAEWPYVADHADIVQAVQAGTYAPPPNAVADQTYGVGAYKIIDAGDGTGESILNTDYLESVLAAGFDIAVGAWVSWEEAENTGIMGLVTNAQGELYKTGGHAMLIVGYDRRHHYFILKNSWGAAWGHAGYGYFGYDFARRGFKYGFTVSSPRP